MALILSIETATTVCSVAITNGKEVVVERKLFIDKSHANQLTLLIQEIIEETKLSMADLECIAVSEGPGSYTGLRIGISTAKGLCYALGIPLIGISTLKAMAREVMTNHSSDTYFCPMIDARRIEVYTALYDSTLTEIMSPHPLVLDESSFQETLESHQLLFFGNGSDKFKSIMTSANAMFIESISPSAWAVGFLAEDRFNNQDFEDLAYFEPSYLKEFQATTPKALL